MATRASRVSAVQAQAQFNSLSGRRQNAYVKGVGGTQKRFTRAAHARGMAAAGSAGG